MIEFSDVGRTPALAVFGASVLLGGLGWWRRRASGDDRAPRTESERATELRNRHEVLLRQLQELEDSRSNRAASEVALEREALEQVAAQVVRELEQEGASPMVSAAQAPTAIEAGPVRPGRRIWLWAAGAVAAAGLILLAFGQASPRQAESVAAVPRPSEGAPSSHGTSSAPATVEEAALKATLERTPGDLEARLELARLRLDQQDYMSVWAETQEVLKRSAGNPRALTYQSQVRLAMGQADVALQMLKQALAKDPGLLQAYVYLSYVHLRLGQSQQAQDVIDDARRRFPGDAAMLASGFAQMKASLGSDAPIKLGEANPHRGLAGAGAPGEPRNPHAGLDPQVGVNPHAGLNQQWGGASLVNEKGAPGGARVSGLIELDRASSSGKGGIVFVTVRPAGAQGGPPIAAKKLEGTSFPLAFALGDADSMQGAPIPDHVLLEARLDGDGDPMTKDPSDPVARQDDVRLGMKDVRLVLKRR